MYQLILKQNNEERFHVPLNRGFYQIGRSPHNDLVLMGAEISREHLKFNFDGASLNGHSLSDAGVWLNGELKHGTFPVDHGDIFKIGNWVIEAVFLGSDFSDHSSFCENTLAGTKLMIDQALLKEKKHRDLLCRVSLVIESPDCRLRQVMKRRSAVLGSSSKADILIRDSFVSGQHLSIERLAEGLLVKDLGSTNGTLLNGVKIRETLFTEERTLLLGQTKLTFHIRFHSETDEVSKNSLYHGMIGNDSKIKCMFQQIDRFASLEMPILIQGETGTGKELVAKALHEASPRHQYPFVVINCGAISPHLIESELFGHEKGSFTGADKKHLGAFERAGEGTLFLDEIGELPLDLQAKLLRALEYRKIRPVGSREEISVKARFVFATHRKLAEMVQLKTFREDLFYRIYVMPITVPPLRERLGDLEELVQHCLNLCEAHDRILTKKAWQKLKKYSWPGNIRELKNVIWRAVMTSPADSPIEEHHIDLLNQENHFTKQNGNKDRLGNLVKDYEKRIIEKALSLHQGDKGATAEYLGVARSSFFRKLKEYREQEES